MPTYQTTYLELDNVYAEKRIKSLQEIIDLTLPILEPNAVMVATVLEHDKKAGAGEVVVDAIPVKQGTRPTFTS